MDKTKIDWCDSTWNPVTGCLNGCEYCYARGIANRFGGNFTMSRCSENGFLELYARPDNPYPDKFSPTFHRYRLNDYIGKQGRNIFVCSMADLFGSWVPDSLIEEVFKACEKAPQHNYLFLTKNPGRYVELNNKGILIPKENMWYGYSLVKSENPKWWNADYNIFASMEPILEPLDIPICKWIIVGAETGRRKGKVIPKREWIEHLVYYCGKWNIPLFMKSSLAEIWGEPLIQEFPKELQRAGKQMETEFVCENCEIW